MRDFFYSDLNELANESAGISGNISVPTEDENPEVIYGKLNKEIEQNEFKGLHSSNTITIVDNENNTIAVEVDKVRLSNDFPTHAMVKVLSDNLDSRITTLESFDGVSQEDFDKLVNNETQLLSNNNRSLAIGEGAFKTTGGTATDIVLIGNEASGSKETVVIGSDAEVYLGYGVAVGYDAYTYSDGVSIGHKSYGSSSTAIAIGASAKAQGMCIQFGAGTNSTDNTLQVKTDNIYNWNTHTLTVQNISLNEVDLNTTLTNKANLTDIPTTVSSFTNDSNYINSTQLNTAITEANTYTDTKVAALVNSAPETLDTLAEVATAIQENETVVEALNASIGSKANDSEVVHLANEETITGLKTFSDDLTFNTDWKGIVLSQGGRLLQYNTDSGPQLVLGSDTTLNSNAKIIIRPLSIYNAMGGIKIADTTITPEIDARSSLGIASYRFTDLYLSGNISDGTNSITTTDLITKVNSINENTGNVVLWEGTLTIGSSTDTSNCLTEADLSLSVGDTIEIEWYILSSGCGMKRYEKLKLDGYGQQFANGINNGMISESGVYYRGPLTIAQLSSSGVTITGSSYFIVIGDDGKILFQHIGQPNCVISADGTVIDDTVVVNITKITKIVE